MKELSDTDKTTDRNKIALILSVIPGLGHIYKHRYLSGFGILTAGNALVILTAVLLTLTTLGLSLIVVPVAWGVYAAYSAYMASDKHEQHLDRFTPWGHHPATR